MPTEIYLKNTVTFVKVTDENNATVSLDSSSKARELTLTDRGVLILPDDDSYTLNNFEIILADLVDNFGATTPEELLNKLAENNFFKKGGGGVSGEEIIKSDDIDSDSSETVATSLAIKRVNSRVSLINNLGHENDPNNEFLTGLI